MSINLPTQFAEVLCAEAGRPRSPDGFVGASQVRPRGDTCFKKLQFHLLKTTPIERPLPFTLALALLRGTVVHNVITNLSGKLPLKVESDVRMVDEATGLSGSADFIMRSDDSGAVVVELKSISPEQFRYLSKPVTKHIYQVHVYMMLSGARKAIVYYVPHSNEQDDDVLASLKRAHKKAQGLGGPLSGVHKKIAEVMSDIGEWKVSKKSEPTVLGRQFEVEFDQAIADEITETMGEVRSSLSTGEWLPKNLDNCELCPFASPCFAGATMSHCDKRSTDPT